MKKNEKKIYFPFSRKRVTLSIKRSLPLSVPALLIFLAFALPASAIDIRSRRIPDLIVFPCFATIFIFLLIAQPELLPNRLAAALLSALFFFVLRRVVGGLGLGDVKFAALIGLCCGLPLACAAFLAAALTGIAGCLIFRQGGKDRPLPFAPYLTAGTVAAFILSKFLRFF
jgi:prepilin signal peptidase PulO-like enzyme (type II secretory pathway)